jgi:epoxyqueuosine reductase QueG
MEFTQETIKFTENIKSRALRYGFDLIGIVSAETFDSIPSHFIGHRDYKCYTKKTRDYLEDAKSLLILGVRVWDSLFDMVIKVKDHYEYPDEWRGRYYARRITRYLENLGFKTILEPDLLSKKRMAQLGGLGNFGKQSLIINPEYGPWLRFRSILTNVELVPSKAFTDDLCGNCTKCIDECPVGALTPYKVDPDKCLLGMTWESRLSEDYESIYFEHSPSLTENTWLMCNTCQKACPIGRDLRFKSQERQLTA